MVACGGFVLPGLGVRCVSDLVGVFCGVDLPGRVVRRAVLPVGLLLEFSGDLSSSVVSCRFLQHVSPRVCLCKTCEERNSFSKYLRRLVLVMN